MLNVRIRGRECALPLILVHAMPLDGSMWDEATSLMGDALTAAVDAPGFGSSLTGAECARRYGDGKPSLRAFAQAIADFAAKQGWERYILGGMSMGGATVAALANLYPERVAGLALMDTNIGADDEAGRQRRKATIDSCKAGDAYSCVAPWTQTMLATQTPQHVRDKLDQEFRHVVPTSLAWLQEAMLHREDETSAVEKVAAPVLLLRGSEDPTCSRAYLEDLAKRAGEAEIVEIPGAGHFSATEQPEALADILQLFVQRCGCKA